MQNNLMNYKDSDFFQKRIPTFSFPLMAEIANGLGINTEELFDSIKLEQEKMVKENHLVSFSQVVTFIRNMVKDSPTKEIGLLIGQQYHINTYGPLGYAMMSCKSWSEAVIIGVKLHRVSSSLTTIAIDIDQTNNAIRISASPRYNNIEDITVFTIEKLFASFIATSKDVVNGGVYPISISFTFSEPEYSELYKEYFQCPITYNANENVFVYDLKSCKTPLLTANPVCAGMARRLCEEHLERYNISSKSYQEKVTKTILEVADLSLNMEDIAQILNVSSRTLRRMLIAEGTTFQTLIDHLRQDLAINYLRNTDMTLEQIAFSVGFSEYTNFRRAFKRWKGVPPGKYRKALIS